MAERPMLMSAPMVRAILDGTKTQTRRVVKPQFAADALPIEMPATDPAGGWVVPGHSGAWWCEAAANPDDVRLCPYGQPGDRLWLRENFARKPGTSDCHWYAADFADFRAAGESMGLRWRPSIHMPRRASRITLEITSVRVERLQDISEADCVSEGCPGGAGAIPGYAYAATPLEHYHWLWNDINGAGAWELNPWVWVVSFRRI